MAFETYPPATGGGGFPGYGNINPVGTATSNGTLPLVARSDHVHAHDNLPGGGLHADVIASGASGFMSGVDKTKLDGIEAGARAIQTLDIPVDFGTGGDTLSASGVAAWVGAATVFMSALVLPNALDHDPEDVLLEQISANVQSVVGTTATVNVYAPNQTWGRYTVRLVGFNP